MDLGASPREALRLVLLPMLAPAIFASLMIVFAISIDDFVISAFLAGGAETQTVPMLIYSSARAAPNPSLNAVASLMLVLSMTAIALGIVMHRRLAGGGQEGAVESFARLEI